MKRSKRKMDRQDQRRREEVSGAQKSTSWGKSRRELECDIWHVCPRCLRDMVLGHHTLWCPLGDGLGLKVTVLRSDNLVEETVCDLRGRAVRTVRERLAGEFTEAEAFDDSN